MSKNWYYTCKLNKNDFSIQKVINLINYIKYLGFVVLNPITNLSWLFSEEYDLLELDTDEKTIEFYLKNFGIIGFFEKNFDIDFSLNIRLLESYVSIDIHFADTLISKDIDFREKSFDIGNKIFFEIINNFNVYYGNLMNDFEIDDYYSNLSKYIEKEEYNIFYYNFHSLKYKEFIENIKSLKSNLLEIKEISNLGYFTKTFNNPWDYNFNNIVEINNKIQGK